MGRSALVGGSNHSSTALRDGAAREGGEDRRGGGGVIIGDAARHHEQRRRQHQPQGALRYTAGEITADENDGKWVVRTNTKALGMNAMIVIDKYTGAVIEKHITGP